MQQAFLCAWYRIAMLSCNSKAKLIDWRKPDSAFCSWTKPADESRVNMRPNQRSVLLIGYNGRSACVPSVTELRVGYTTNFTMQVGGSPELKVELNLD